MTVVGAEPDYDFVCASEDLGHEADLVHAFCGVGLVDAESVDPKPRVQSTRDIAGLLEELVQIVCDEAWVAIYNDRTAC